MFKLSKRPEDLKNEAGSGFRVKCEATEDAVELTIFDEIGWDIDASDVHSFLAENRNKPVHATINSFGGDAYDGLAIYSMLKNHSAQVTTNVIGIAYSAASIIFMGGDERLMSRESDLGIHRAWAGAVGNANSMRAMANWLDVLDGHLVDLYAAGSDRSPEQINQMLDADDGFHGTVMPATQALEYGFATGLAGDDAGAAVAARASDQVRQNVHAKLNAEAALARLRRQAV